MRDSHPSSALIAHQVGEPAGDRLRKTGRRAPDVSVPTTFRVPTPYNKYVAGSAPAARALRPTWPSSVCGSGAEWRVFSNRLLVAERWWATSATSERYMKCASTLRSD